MSGSDLKLHWENMYQTKKITEFGWYQQTPKTSLDFISELDPEKHAKIIDIGGGDSYFTDYLLQEGYTDLTVLDISEKAIERAKKHLGTHADEVQWIISDITKFEPLEKYDIWHDRAAFHFLRTAEEVDLYLGILKRSLNPGGVFILGTFSDHGPTMCSGLKIKQYSESEITHLLNPSFDKIKCTHPNHITPGGGVQNYTFCSFRKKR